MTERMFGIRPTRARRSDRPRKTSFKESAEEWPASLSIAAEPESRPTASFASAMTILAKSGT
jgi:hypothetical protein